MRSEAVKRAQERYAKKLKRKGIKIQQNYLISCSTINDKDVIEILDNQQNRSQYIKDLVRKDQKGK